MNHPDDPELSPAERRALAGLQDAVPPRDLEDAVVAEMRGQGLIRGGSPWRTASLAVAMAASLVAAFFLGTLVDRGASTGEPAGEQSRFLLLLHAPPADWGAPTDPAQVEAYAAWARQERSRGRVEGGEKLEDSGFLILPEAGRTALPESGMPRFLGGFFVIRADDYDAAAAIAERSPHVSGGGIVELRRIEEL